MESEKLIFDNRSSRPLYLIIDHAIEAYLNFFDPDRRYVEVAWKGSLLFHMTENKRSRTIRITDIPKED